ncbi:uncharacterized protein isoform X2 [Leptinotarsa decemlineata]|uniref:uncharacterized protein isoform X2 n=1 Tax=Leptinotarsa decemlineata TaxID=7539 RepID=UPI003D30995B
MNVLEEEDKKETIITLKDFPFICRICCLKQSDLRPFDEEDYLFDLFHVIRKIDVNSTNSTTNFPENICNECVIKLEDISLFIDISKYNNHSKGKNSITVKIENEGKDVVEPTHEDSSVSVSSACRICLSPNGATLFQEKPQMVQLFKDLTDIDVAHINSQNVDRICDTCSEKLEEISSFITQSSRNEGIFENVLHRSNAVKSESYPHPSNFNVKIEEEHEIIDVKGGISCEVETDVGRNCLGGSQSRSAPVPAEKSDQFPYCPKRFTPKSHLFTHTEGDLFECNACDKSFIGKPAIVRHLSVHTRDKRFECSICLKKFTRGKYLRRHLLAHSGQTFDCQYCKKSYISKPSLKAHMSIHTREKLFECNVCQREFTRNQYLKRHLTVHSGKDHMNVNTAKKVIGINALYQPMCVLIQEKNFLNVIFAKRNSPGSKV